MNLNIFPQLSKITTKTIPPKGWKHPSLSFFSREKYRTLIGLGSLDWKSFLESLPPSPFPVRIEWGGRSYEQLTCIEIDRKQTATIYINPSQISQMELLFAPFFGAMSFERLAIFAIAHEIGHAWDEIIISHNDGIPTLRTEQFKEAFADSFAAVALRVCGTPETFIEHLALWRDYYTEDHGSSMALRNGLRVPVMQSEKITSEDWFLRLALCEKIARLHHASFFQKQHEQHLLNNQTNHDKKQL